MKWTFFFLVLVVPCISFGIDYQLIDTLLSRTENKNFFHYDVHIETRQGKSDDQSVMICAHGKGGDYTLIDILEQIDVIDDHLVSFNFPDFGKFAFERFPYETSFGTIEELVPLLFVIKKCVVDGQMDRINLYGFSLGGGAIVNAIGVLHHDRYENELLKIGISEKEKKQMLSAIQNGRVILDVPLKSIDELIASRGPTPDLIIFQKRYTENMMRPIDVVGELYPLKLNVLIHFQDPDKALSNRDDVLYIQRLKTANQNGTTTAVIGKDGGHLSYHASLWEAYAKEP